MKWKGRQLDAIIVKSIIQQKNRIMGAYSRDCFVFGLIDDDEFAMQREVYSAACGSGDQVDQVDQVVRDWQVGNEFQSLWNAERTGEIQSKTRVGDLQSAQPGIQDQQRIPWLPGPTELKLVTPPARRPPPPPTSAPPRPFNLMESAPAGSR